MLLCCLTELHDRLTCAILTEKLAEMMVVRTTHQRIIKTIIFHLHHKHKISQMVLHLQSSMKNILFNLVIDCFISFIESSNLYWNAFIN